MTASQVHNKRIELKYLLDTRLSLEVRQWACENLGVDGHCSECLGDSYEINTLYFDTPELSLFHRLSNAGKTKHRIRRYGDETTLWVETKRKKGNVVFKNRTASNESDVTGRLLNLGDDSPWCGDWFASRILERHLQPTIQVHYRRFARTSTLDGQGMRLTIDSRLQASPANSFNVASSSDKVNRELRTNAASVEILELKFQNSMPHLFKQLLRMFSIPATGFSKYRTAVSMYEMSPTGTVLPGKVKATSEESLLNA